MKVNHALIKDSITKSKDFWLERKELAKIHPPTREDILGLRFRSGQKVKDLVTGKEVEIIGGAREIATFPGPGGEGGGGLPGKGS